MLSFPTNPTEGQVFYSGNVEWTFTNGGWRRRTKEKSFDMTTSSAIDLKKGDVFKKTITGATTFTITNTPPTGVLGSFALQITNGGSAGITWWSNLKWTKGSPPSLTVSGTDILGFYTEDNGGTWRGFVMSTDSK